MEILFTINCTINSEIFKYVSNNCVHICNNNNNCLIIDGL